MGGSAHEFGMLEREERKEVRMFTVGAAMWLRVVKIVGVLISRGELNRDQHRRAHASRRNAIGALGDRW